MMFHNADVVVVDCCVYLQFVDWNDGNDARSIQAVMRLLDNGHVFLL